jgi:hypothetical protein
VGLWCLTQAPFSQSGVGEVASEEAPGQGQPIGIFLSSLPSEHGVPTSVAFTSIEPAHIVASFRSGDTVLYDLEAGSAVLTLESRGSSGKGAPSPHG